MNQSCTNPDAIVRLKDVLRETSLSKTTTYDRSASGIFSHKIKIGRRAVGFRRGDLDAWLANPAEYRAEAE
jgi:prophage regulatory protein